MSATRRPSSLQSGSARTAGAGPRPSAAAAGAEDRPRAARVVFVFMPGSLARPPSRNLPDRHHPEQVMVVRVHPGRLPATWIGQIRRDP